MVGWTTVIRVRLLLRELRLENKDRDEPPTGLDSGEAELRSGTKPSPPTSPIKLPRRTCVDP
eukprot:2406542-Prymnesium_polylepis.1